jgi:hypothetical protein
MMRVGCMDATRLTDEIDVATADATVDEASAENAIKEPNEAQAFI